MTTVFIYIAVGAFSMEGVKKKLRAKIESLNNQSGITVHCLYFCNDIQTEMTEENITYVPFYFKGKIPSFWEGRFFWRLQEYYVRKEKFKLIYKKLSSFKGYQGIIFRYLPADFNSFIFGLKNFKKVVLEHNTVESEEIKLIRNEVIKNYYRWSESIFGPLTRIVAKCLVSVTNEIAKQQKKTAWSLVQSTTIGNGIAVDEYPEAKIKKYEKDSPLHVLFTSGFGNIWHGVDLLLRSIADEDDVVLHLVGEFERNIHDAIPNNRKKQVIFYDKLEGKAYNEVYEKAHVAVSSLAMYRIGLKEGAVLKSREYTSRGIPFILGHVDPDFVDPEISSFIFKVNVNEQQLINFTQVKSFLEGIRNQNYHQMRQYAKNKLNYDAKAKEYKRILMS